MNGDTSKAMWYPTSQVLGDIANQCGFEVSSPSASRMDKLCYNDIKGKSCRQILEDISKLEVGWWITNGDNRLAFVPFSPNKTGFEIAENDRSEIQLRLRTKYTAAFIKAARGGKIPRG